MAQYITFGSVVNYITPFEKTASGWRWKIIFYDLVSSNKQQQSIIVDGVMICTGRHGGSGLIPSFKGLEKYSGTVLHSSQYKNIDKHDLRHKRVVVVGNGNSSLDIVTEVSPKNKKTYLVSRSGAWVHRSHLGEDVFYQGEWGFSTLALIYGIVCPGGSSPNIWKIYQNEIRSF